MDLWLAPYISSSKLIYYVWRISGEQKISEKHKMKRLVLILSQGIPSNNSGGPSGISYKLIYGLLKIKRQYDIGYLYSNKVLINNEITNYLENIRPQEKNKITTFVKEIISKRNAIEIISRLFAFYIRTNFIIKAIKSYEKVIVLSMNPWYSYFLFKLKNKLNSTKLVHIYGDHAGGGYDNEIELLYKQNIASKFYTIFTHKLVQNVIENTDYFLFPSEAAKREFFQWRKIRNTKNSMVIYNGIDDNFSYCKNINKCIKENSKWRFTTIAQHVKQKRIETIINALKLLKNDGINFEWILIGDVTEYTNRLIKIIEENNLTSNVNITGKIEKTKVYEYLSNTDIFILCPEIAPFDLALLEAMCFNLPIISSKVSGNIEALGEDYEYFAWTDKEIYERILFFIKNPEKIKEVGGRNRDRFLKHFTQEKMVQNYDELFNRIFEL